MPKRGVRHQHASARVAKVCACSLRRIPLALALCGALQAAAAPQAQSTNRDLAVPPLHWAEAAIGMQERIVNSDDSAPLRYRVRRTDAKGETLREVIESRQGTVARLVERNGRPLTAEEDTDERQRLQAILDHPDAFLRHIRREEGSRSYALELLHSMPKAMVWTYVPGQPQLSDAQHPAVVLDFKPDPHFKPPSLITEALTGIAGRVWIDAPTHCVTRIQGTILHPVDFGWGGVLARVKEGGVIEFAQSQASNGRWLYSHVVEHISIREMLVHTSDENAEVTVTHVQPLPAPLAVQDAVHLLLALPGPGH